MDKPRQDARRGRYPTSCARPSRTRSPSRASPRPNWSPAGPRSSGRRSPPIASRKKSSGRAPTATRTSSPARWCCGSKGRPRSRSSTCRKIILERVNRFFGWQAVADLRLRQAPLGRREKPKPPVPDHAAAERIASSLTEISDEKLRAGAGPARRRRREATRARLIKSARDHPKTPLPDGPPLPQ